MNKLINILNQDGQLVVTSRQIAEDFGKRNSHVVEAIENKIESLTAENSEVEISKLFIPTTYNHNGNEYKEYLLTRDGFTFIVMGFTGAKADAWKLKYIEAFNKMEKTIREQSKPLSAMDQLRLQYQVIEEHEERVTKIESQLERLEVNPSQRKAIQNARHRRVSELLGGKKTIAYKDSSFRAKVYSEMGRAFNNYFDVPAYDCTPKNRFKEALELIKSYNLSVDLSMELKRINNQVEFEEVI
ncbi:Rha family transcriptional regulator [Clostridium sp.]|uniref:Rha family transcriptional regulator n=1 Tax=Clostridium sp. TaxID=1506 RepID=UPI001EC04BE6|nr:Rha family transcriptional regulator [Clostridium sp.]MBS5886019.1 ORF6C domain-containing protein [Clostridium sp.]